MTSSTGEPGRKARSIGNGHRCAITSVGREASAVSDAEQSECAITCSASGVHQRSRVRQSVRALCALCQLSRRAAVVRSRSAAGQAVGDHLSSWQGCVSHRPSAAQRGLACAASAGIACVHRDAGHRVGWLAHATRFESGVSQRRQAQAGSRRSVAAILELTFFFEQVHLRGQPPNYTAFLPTNLV